MIGTVTRSLRKNTDVWFLITYADPAQGHVGTIYQATNWLYTGLSTSTPLYDAGDGVARHSRSFGQVFGTHSIRHFERHGVNVRTVPQSAKHRYVYFVDRDWQKRLLVPVLPYPKHARTQNTKESNSWK